MILIPIHSSGREHESKAIKNKLGSAPIVCIESLCDQKFVIHSHSNIRRYEDMSYYRKIHITLTPENYQAVRKAAFDEEITISEAIDNLIAEKLMKPEPPIPPEPEVPPPNPSESRPTAWSVTTLRNR
jgi:hypothetical protein